MRVRTAVACPAAFQGTPSRKSLVPLGEGSFPLSIQRAPETSAHLEATTSSFRRFLPRTSVILSRSAQRTRSYNFFPGKAYAFWLVRKMRRRSRDIGISRNRPPIPAGFASDRIRQAHFCDTYSGALQTLRRVYIAMDGR